MIYFIVKDSRIKKKIKLFKTKLEDKVMSSNVNLWKYNDKKWRHEIKVRIIIKK